MRSAAALAVLLLPALAAAETRWTPFQLGVTPRVQLFDATRNVYGLRLNLGFGENQTVAGLDLGLANLVDQGVFGLQLAGIFNLADRFSVAVQLAPVNLAVDLVGVQAGLLNVSFRVFGHASVVGIAGGAVNIHGRVRGVQAGLFNSSGKLFQAGPDPLDGAQLGLFNFAERVNGLQVGVLNVVGGSPVLGREGGIVRGVQVGLINYCRRLRGVQIGVINIVREGIPFLPVVNVGL